MITDQPLTETTVPSSSRSGMVSQINTVSLMTGKSALTNGCVVVGSFSLTFSASARDQTVGGYLMLSTRGLFWSWLTAELLLYIIDTFK
ncbi:hypothetical protein PL963_P400060 (plasmid) [Pseudomonas cerasi]|uniref:Uncharacterized protein n=1 Tax=Pseudomonas cerasi TaxID=1583341 RepID=A0A2K4W3J7_9PSED|nr:hypothetical protein PL963_P400060 [Pseudomonas cerasi]